MPKPTDLFTIDLLGEIFHFNMLDKNKHHPNQDQFKETLFLINMGEDAFQYDCESKITTHPRIDSKDLYFQDTGEIYMGDPPSQPGLILRSHVYNQYENA